ncbi:MAG: hypothetical protein ACPGQD_04505 [Planctomycetota bacterium]
MAFLKTFARYTRPADTTQYASGDLVGGVFEFDVTHLPRANGIIRTASLFKTNTTVTAANFLLHLFEQPLTADQPADNAAWTFATHALAEWWVGSVAMDLTSGTSEGSDGVVKHFAVSDGPFFQRGASDLKLFGILLAQATYTPTSEERFAIQLGVES